MERGFWRSNYVKFTYKEWNFLLDIFTRSHGKTYSIYTRLRVPFKNITKLKLRIHQEHLFSSVFKFFGSVDIQLGDREFDSKFMIKGNNEFAIIQLLNDIELKKLLMQLDKGFIQIKDKKDRQKFPKI